jgi:hypothetical protein
MRCKGTSILTLILCIGLFSCDKIRQNGVLILGEEFPLCHKNIITKINPYKAGEERKFSSYLGKMTKLELLIMKSSVCDFFDYYL